jgi:serine/threonine-protein kinase
VLRREAEGMILPDLRAFLEGREQPRDGTERLALIGVCEFENRTATLAGLLAAALADPSLAGDPRGRLRQRAARSAALAGCGRGEDAAELGEAERSHWREQARHWLLADREVLLEVLAGGDEHEATQALAVLAEWKSDPDLAGVRDPDRLALLPVAERDAWRELWAPVDAAVARFQGSAPASDEGSAEAR